MDYDFSQIQRFIIKYPSVVRISKIFVFLASSYYISHILYNNFSQIKGQFFHKKQDLFWFIIISSSLYVFLLFVLAKAWKKSLELLQSNKVNNNLIFIYLRSQIYKYLPGNIFHYANRQLAAKKQGISHKALLKSNLSEILGLLAGAFIFSLSLIERWDSIVINTAIGAIVVVLFIILRLKQFRFLTIVLKVLPYYLIYFLCIGIICYCAINYLTANNVSIFICIALYSSSWITGFIIPGAPGGVGVRESVFMLLSESVLQQADALFIIVLLRIATTIGEIIAFSMTCFFKLSSKN